MDYMWSILWTPYNYMWFIYMVHIIWTICDFNALGRLKYDQIKVDFERNKPEWQKLINKHSEAEVKDEGTVAVSMLVDKELNENREIRKLNTRVDIQQE